MSKVTPSRLRRLVPALGLAVTGGLLLSSPAAADVTISPAQAVQGDAASVTFRVGNHRAGAHTTKVEINLPAETPIAEVYPMTVADWAPRIVSRPVDRPLPGIHGGGLTTATSAVVWTRASDAPPAPAVEELRLELGPLPYVDRLVFTVVQTYSDGTVQRWSGPSSGPGTALTLTRAPSAPAAGHGHGRKAAATPDPAAAAAAVVAAPAAGSALSTAAGPDRSDVNALTVVGVGGFSLVLTALIVYVTRGSSRRRDDEARAEG